MRISWRWKPYEKPAVAVANRPRTMTAMLMAAGVAHACDSCGCALLPVDERTLERGWRLGVARQYTLFDHLQDAGVRIANDAGEEIQSSLTRWQVGYQFDERNALTVSIPF